MNKIPLSVIIICFNEEKRIAECLSSISFASEIIVVDSFSTDRTMEILKQFPQINVFQREWKGYYEQKLFALSKASNDWILNLDADESLSLKLQKEIIDVVLNDKHHSGFNIPEQPYFCGKFIRHSSWYPQYNFRLFRKSKVRMDETGIHESFRTNGKIGNLTGEFFHFSYENLEDYLDKLNSYTSLEAIERINRGRRIKFYHIPTKFIQTFIRMYFLKSGFLDGLEGFVLCYLSGFYEFVKFIKQREIETK